MKVRLRFSKTGALVYIGHLDVMRYFQKLFRRAGIPVAYSEGFSPHQILSFTPPLPLGMESEGEYADVELVEPVLSKDALYRIAETSVPEITVTSFRLLPDRCENAMASVKAARYEVIFPKEMSGSDMTAAADDFLKKDSVVVLKKSKKTEKEIDIRPLVYELKADDKGRVISMLISSGSVDNIKPELVLNAMFGDKLTEFDTGNIMIKRIDQFTLADDKLISLDEIGTDIT